MILNGLNYLDTNYRGGNAKIILMIDIHGNKVPKTFYKTHNFLLLVVEEVLHRVLSVFEFVRDIVLGPLIRVRNSMTNVGELKISLFRDFSSRTYHRSSFILLLLEFVFDFVFSVFLRMVNVRGDLELRFYF